MSLPILSNSFFEKHRPSLDVFLKWQSAASWSSNFMPIYFWDDVLFVGCSHPPTQKVNTSQKVVYVFCEAEALSQLWEEYQSPTVLMKVQPNAESPAFEVSEEMANEKTVVMGPESSAERTVVAPDMPEGLSVSNNLPSAAPQSASFDDLGFASSDESSSEETSDATPSLDQESPLEGLDLSATPTVVLSPATAQAIGDDAPAPPAILERTSVSKTIPQEAVASEEEETLPAIEKKTQEEQKETKTLTNITSLTSTNASPEQIFQAVFKDMGNIFKKTMLLMRQGEQIVPWKWDEGFEKSNPEHKKSALSLAVPSPFRIVYRSQKSYHGHIVPNDLNDRFFAEWNNSQSPDHLTLSPILIDDVVIGMVMGIGDKSADTKTCLLQTEHMAEALAKKIKALPQIAKAA